LTVTFAAPKVAHVLLPASAAVGDVVVADLGIPAELLDRAEGQLHLTTAEDFCGALPPRPRTSHKGDFGHAIIVAGSEGKTGAAILAARGAVRSGAGLVTVATPGRWVPTVDLGSLESMTFALSEASEGGLALASVDEILDCAVGKQVLAVGPGLGTEPSTQAVIKTILRKSEVPVVLDADGINAFAGNVDELGSIDGPRILTPHAGELARLLGIETGEIQADRVGRVQEAANRSRSVVVLKGNQTLIAEPEGTVWINPSGNSGMATGGTGDVLTGIITGFVSQGLDLTMAARLGVFVHGVSGDLCLESLGQEGLTAGDLLGELPAAFESIRS
jgi:NAD(P)H-hydrate epimerase